MNRSPEINKKKDFLRGFGLELVFILQPLRLIYFFLAHLETAPYPDSKQSLPPDLF